jgi:hypothetical protein
MPRFLIAFIAVLLTTAALGADLRLTGDWPPADKRPSERFYATFRLRNLSRETAHDITVRIFTTPGLTDPVLRANSDLCANLECTIRQLAPSSDLYIDLLVNAPVTPGRVTIIAIASSPDDPDTLNNSAAYELDVISGPDLNATILGIGDQAAFAPEEKITISALVANKGVTAATQVELTVDFPEGVTILSREGGDNFDCDLAAKPVLCRAASLPIGSQPPIRFRISTPPLYSGGTMTVAVHVRSAERDINRVDNDSARTAKIKPFFSVTSSDDDGPGSLRQAILEANALCRTSCTIGWRIPAPLPAAGFFTIKPKTPLPAINFTGEVDGSAEANYLDLDQGTLRIMIDGSLLSSGDGLWFQSSTDVHALAIGNFPGSGIYLETVPTSKSSYVSWIDHVYLGVDPTGHRAAPNERGLLDTATPGMLQVTNSAISGNRRSGIVSTNRQAYISENRIGVAADSNAALPNGASGIFLIREKPANLDYTDAQVLHNVIGNHRDFGIAVFAPSQHSFLISQNSMFNDVANGIDYGLDGPTPNVADDSRRPPNRPTVSAVTRQNNITTITIELVTRARTTLFPENAPVPGYSYTASSAYVEIYASHGPGQTERYLGALSFPNTLPDGGSIFLKGNLVVDEDLRGQWITAVAIRSRSETRFDLVRGSWETSESSPAVVVR